MSITDLQARAEFERQHEGRNLKRHRMRGTYLSAPIAALWNQHIRTIKWMGAQQSKAIDAGQPAANVGAQEDKLPTEAEVQSAEATLYRDLTGDAMAMGYGGIPAALEALRRAAVADGELPPPGPAPAAAGIAALHVSQLSAIGSGPVRIDCGEIAPMRYPAPASEGQWWRAPAAAPAPFTVSGWFCPKCGGMRPDSVNICECQE